MAWMVSGNAGVVIGVGLLHSYLSQVWCLVGSYRLLVWLMDNGSPALDALNERSLVQDRSRGD